MQQGSSSNSGQRLHVTVAGDEGSARLDRVLAVRLAQLSRSRLKALILAGSVTLKSAPVRDPAYHVSTGDTITIDVPEAVAAEPAGEAIALDIVYEDDDIIVIDKPKGLVVHPAAGHETGTLVGRSGAMRRGYMALVWDLPNRQRGTVDAPIDRHPYAREKMAVRESGREAVTHWEIQESFNGRDGKPVAALLACQLETGRTHQIRVHLAHIGHPLLGDGVYGPHFKTKASHLGPQSQAALAALGRQALHAYLLTLEHPQTGAILEWISDLPEDLIHLRDNLRAAL